MQNSPKYARKGMPATSRARASDLNTSSCGHGSYYSWKLIALLLEVGGPTNLSEG
nr:hypothetical protein Q903MT_gene1031 [Picea sitchensis]